MTSRKRRGSGLAGVVAIVATVGFTTSAAGSTLGTGTPVGTILYEDTGTCTYDPTEDGAHLNESCTTTLWTVDARTRWRRHLTPGTGGRDGAWSPDGRAVLFVSFRDFELWSTRASGSGKRRLTHGSHGVASPSWSPDGRRIAFVSGARNRVLVVIDADGSGRRTLARAADEILQLAWSPRGNALAFSDGNTIYVVDAKGGSPRFLMDGDRPTWSPDGSQIAFVETVEGPSGNALTSLLSVIGADGTDLRPLTRGGSFDGDPTWAPNGRELAFTRQTHDWASGMYRIRTDGTGLRRVTAPARDPAWSPGGKWIAYTNDDGRVYVVRPDGSGRTKLGPGGAPLHWRPVAS